MTTNKKNVNAFQDALLSNTKVIGHSASEKTKKKTTKQTATTKGLLSKSSTHKLDILAEKYDMKSADLANYAISLLVDFEDVLFREEE
ncbi:hypothetical protein OAO55_01200 [Bacteroidales bacterium]|nr:hypothetical protein [Bacteroidales bacterium]